MKLYVKKNKNQNSEILAVCDPELIGKKFENKHFKLDITERFYKGELLEENEVIRLIQNAKSINIVGKNSIKLAIKTGIVGKENIIKIKNIPHAIVFET